MVSPSSDDLGLVDRHKYWACDFRFEMRMGTNRLVIKKFLGFHSVEVISLLPHDSPVV